MCQPPGVFMVESDSTGKTRVVAAALCFASMFTIASSIPFTTTKRQNLLCDSLCLGGMTSMRSILSLVGAPLAGRLSDRIGRRAALLTGGAATFFSMVLTAYASTKQGLWLALVPSSLFSHQFDALKAVLADAYTGKDAAVLAGAQGTLGIAAGFGFVGSSFGGILTTGPRLAFAALIGFLISLALTLLIPGSKPTASTSPSSSKTSSSKVLAFLHIGRDLVSLPCARTRSGLLLLFIRAGAALAFHVFNTIWQPSLVRRFPNWGTVDTSRFMTFVGILYAFSQGLVAPRVLHFAASSKLLSTSNLLVLCCLLLSCGRLVAISTTNLTIVYLAYAAMIIALGTFNSAITSAVSRVAPTTERGGFFGLLSAMESVCGIIGPLLSGSLATLFGEIYVCYLVLTLYAIVAVLVAAFWHSLSSLTFHDKMEVDTGFTTNNTKKKCS